MEIRVPIIDLWNQKLRMIYANSMSVCVPVFRSTPEFCRSLIVLYGDSEMCETSVW